VPFFAIKKWGLFGKIIFIPKKIVGRFGKKCERFGKVGGALGVLVKVGAFW
jgi:hypothetical protein